MPIAGRALWLCGAARATTIDSIYGNNGIVTDGSVTYHAGEVGQAFNLDGRASRIIVPATPARFQISTEAGFFH